jgi:hypothetical protein
MLRESMHVFRRGLSSILVLGVVAVLMSGCVAAVGPDYGMYSYEPVPPVVVALPPVVYRDGHYGHWHHHPLGGWHWHDGRSSERHDGRRG